jgi:hypothetical protein
MKSILTELERENFLIRLYFKTDKNFKTAGIKRAYLDFSRTLVLPKNCKTDERNTKRAKTELFLKTKLIELIKKSDLTQAGFDKLHEKLCADLKFEWDELTIGQAQKWINMSLKYWLLFGESRIPNIESNSKFFHIPIDSIIQERFFQKNLPAWSKIQTYKEYFWYQKDFRERHVGKIPVLEEFREFNKV